MRGNNMAGYYEIGLTLEWAPALITLSILTNKTVTVGPAGILT